MGTRSGAKNVADEVNGLMGQSGARSAGGGSPACGVSAVSHRCRVRILHDARTSGARHCLAVVSTDSGAAENGYA
jgi:hypothetical protein